MALEAARILLVENGPQGVTLKAVAARIDRTHANVLHHFGTAADLHRELAKYMASHVCQSISDAIHARRVGEATPRDVGDLVFDAFDQGGAAALSSWAALSRNTDTLEPILASIRSVVEEFSPDCDARELARISHLLVLWALGDALMGEQLSNALDLPRSTARDVAESTLKRWFEEDVFRIGA
ncbi:TetR family transcriptional regulator [Altererythrobacter endophyticus]|uniref:TetR family transcriptional regulator n=2 Tax=Altericroceibacterium endophyticum TaxID=1808508 RepID=A0A6I4T893_9SPHN|nr:TetR family transcriptional regulator [Altericroceibacterium endophyticum]MXO66898.1 TetR family transcriptional regulator [Altericroceibacterium endophyticum]